MEKKLHRGTLCVQAGWTPKKGEPRVLPIYQSTTFKYETSEQMARLFDLEESGYFYTRLQNPSPTGYPKTARTAGRTLPGKRYRIRVHLWNFRRRKAENYDKYHTFDFRTVPSGERLSIGSHAIGFDRNAKTADEPAIPEKAVPSSVKHCISNRKGHESFRNPILFSALESERKHCFFCPSFVSFDPRRPVRGNRGKCAINR